jgi:elongator complex protein 6
LSSPDLAIVSGEIQNVIRSLKDANGEGNVVLVIDQLDLLLAAGGDHVGAVDLGEMLIGLREVLYVPEVYLNRELRLTFIQEAHSTILSVSADYPLVSESQTPLERDHAAFVLNISHEADLLMSLRLLDTGTARDVSGVLRITVGDILWRGNQDVQKRTEGKELLYFLGGDGGVKLFERGQ